MSYDEIHKGEAAAVNVGVDLTQLTTGMLVGEAGATSDVVGGGGADAGGEREGLLAGGTVYWDDVAGAYRVKAVPVATPSGAITVSSELSLVPGESAWVRVDNTAGTYTAEIVYDDDDTDEHTVALVPLGTVSEDGLTVSQAHVGAVVVAGLGEKVVVKKRSGGGTITLDATELDEGDDIGIHTLTVGEDVYYILSDTDITLSEGSGGTAGVTSIKSLTGAVEVIGGTGITVTTSGQTIIIGYQEGKSADSDPNAVAKDDCDHPSSPAAESDGGGGGSGGGGGGVDGDKGNEEHTGGTGGCTDCGDGQGSVASASGSTTAGSSGKAAGASVSTVKGKQATQATVNGNTSGSTGKASTGTTPTTASSSSDSSHASVKNYTKLTNSRSMNDSPYKTSGNYTAIGTGTRTSIYTNTYGKLTNARTMNKSPYAK